MAELGKHCARLLPWPHIKLTTKLWNFLKTSWTEVLWQDIRKSHVETGRRGRCGMHRSHMHHVCWLRIKRDISGTEVPPEEQPHAVLLRPRLQPVRGVPITSGCENQWGLQPSESRTRCYTSSRAQAQTHSLWAPVQRQQLEKHQGHKERS